MLCRNFVSSDEVNLTKDFSLCYQNDEKEETYTVLETVDEAKGLVSKPFCTKRRGKVRQRKCQFLWVAI